ncbi:class I SAM-dependent methyltransferase [Candidatus Mycobacterium wuenschmannii]|uniref:Class I SAM-dependent methyltransferase n=1 Tax=Candidatus Mycobacterium wuenschmannii TaxID=3027808 RepID=A0ABY8VR61_9MYCO|nr:class I SAM-dependent methyltransferase [Candidatus Mycobacterium wuenschmannii]WIM85997.1 class I SAM-dependent methyltransferase [Candidatus Mycobacterium wuenschmannii]
MGFKRTLFRLLYRFGFTPWDGHPIAKNLQDLVADLPAGNSLDLGCGTGDASIYLAQHGWTATGVDYVDQPLEAARAKAAAAKANVNFVKADVTKLSREGIGSNFQLIVDNGCLHNLSDGDRDHYVREVSAVAAPQARLLIVAFLPGGRFGVRGAQPTEMERRFTDTWTLLSSGTERQLDEEQTPAKFYLYERKSP